MLSSGPRSSAPVTRGRRISLSTAIYGVFGFCVLACASILFVSHSSVSQTTFTEGTLLRRVDVPLEQNPIENAVKAFAAHVSPLEDAVEVILAKVDRIEKDVDKTVQVDRIETTLETILAKVDSLEKTIEIKSSAPVEVGLSEKAVDKVVAVVDPTCGGHLDKDSCASTATDDCQWCDSIKQCLHRDKFCKMERTWMPPEPEPWFTPPKKDYAVTLSVVLACGCENEYFDRTVRSVFAATPPSLLKEIVVVDDNSDPPLEPLFPEGPSQYKVKYVRSDVTLGVVARHAGGMAASGDIIVFLDCHMKPALGYWEPFVREISEKPRRVVVPMITGLNADTWIEEKPRPVNGRGYSKCYLTVDGQFKWTNDDTPWVPMMSLGALAIGREWFLEVGGFDTSMKGWGGENLDLSLRIWLCGGDIVSAPNSFVAHMFRDDNHQAKYIVPPDSSINNIARAMKAHLPKVFREKTIAFENFSRWRESRGSDLDVESIKEPLKNMQCHDTDWYFDFFSYIYRDAGQVPKEVFQLTHDGGTTCLQLASDRLWGNGQAAVDKLELKPCTSVSGADMTDKGTQFWHLANRNADGKCCSGLQVWNTDQCIIGNLETVICDLDGGQPAELTTDGLLKVGSMCLGADPLGEVKCNGAATKWEKLRPFQPIEYTLLDKNLQVKW